MFKEFVARARMTRYSIATSLIVMASVLSGCAQPAIMDINDSSLKVQYYPYNSPQQVQTEADRGCALYNKKAIAVSDSTVPAGFSSISYRLFACQTPSG